jgi:lysophospholipase L1-like esterase
VTRSRFAAVATAAAALAACGTAQTTPAIAPGPVLAPAGMPVVFAALGASETAGAGLSDMSLQLRAAWPQLFFNAALPRAATYYNYGVGGITAAEALQLEVPAALAVHPTLATVFFTLNDLVRGVSSARFEADLDVIVHALRQGGRATVLVANTPHLEDLPAYRACLSPLRASTCPFPTPVTVPPPSEVAALVDAYDAAAARVAAREGAILVDLAANSADVIARPELVAEDGFHPSPLGHAEIARLFAVAYAQRR